MISIVEKKTNKQVGETSLFVSFKYNANIINAIKSISNWIYDGKEKVWELPASSLSMLLDVLCGFDDISLTLLKDKKKEEQADVVLIKHKINPFDYQAEAIQFGLKHDRWLLLDAPGLGKSLTAIYLAEELKKRDKIEHCLVVCGINMLKFNWVKEIKKFSKLDVRILGERTTRTGKTKIGSIEDRKDDLKKKIKEFFVITNIETLRDKDVVKLINSGKNNFDMIVVDEIHACKNPQSQQGENLLKVNKAKFRIGMTGTLLMNNPLDTFLPLKWIGAENSNLSNFKKYYCMYDGYILTGFKNMQYLKYQLADYTLRRTKDILDLPPKTIINEYIDMSDTQAKFYDDVQNGVIRDVDKVKLNTANLLALTSRLRQATACPSVLTTKNVPSAKVDRALDLIEQITSSGDKVVVFSTFKETVKNLCEKLDGINYVSCTGDDNDADISERINKFQTDDNCKVLCGTWQKCGTGITLTSATYMVFLDTPWTDAVYTQAQDRIYRIGTKDKVTIYNLICKDTIDERVLEIVNDKSALSDYIIDDVISQSGAESLKKYILELQNSL